LHLSSCLLDLRSSTVKAMSISSMNAPLDQRIKENILRIVLGNQASIGQIETLGIYLPFDKGVRHDDGRDNAKDFIVCQTTMNERLLGKVDKV
jgi:hypothetical protein